MHLKYYIITIFGALLISISCSDAVFADGIPEVESAKKVSASSPSSSSGGGSSETRSHTSYSAKESTGTKLPAYSLKDSELTKYQYCGRDSDCIQVINGCCQCMQGDPFTAINKEMLADFMSRFSCNKVVCPEDSKTHSCNDGVVSCINFRCHYFPPQP